MLTKRRVIYAITVGGERDERALLMRYCRGVILVRIFLTALF